ncbi:MAG: nicotinate-nucleotide--dimethylbenzimidazole phosphoribosyltransferase [Proteobacteria bacterium]|nr:nicotinate-nucleotide--dimethylbenzimidazole phosphoribosyltransferase [Pseudomonadota bacterium]
MTAFSRADVQARLDSLAKPPGSLGRLERLAARLAETQGTLRPETTPRRLLIFAGDHGVVEEGIGLWPSDVTAAIMRLTLQGRSAAGAIAQSVGADVVLVDAGSKAPAGLSHRDWRVRQGTANLAQGPAMSAAEFHAALDLGERAVQEAADAGIHVLALGEIGIGNTTIAACLAALLTGADAAAMVGPGAGANDATLARKRAVVAAAVSRARPMLADDPRAALAAVCGFEVAAMAGAILAAARRRMTVVLDGYIVGAAALVAQRLDPAGLSTAIAAHCGAEPGHAAVLGALGLEPFLQWDLRLGEGTGALLLLPLLDAAAALLRDMATLAEAMGG